MRWSAEQLADYNKRRGIVPGAANTADTSAPPFKLPNNEAGRYALGRLPAGTMNKTEAAYAAHLELQRHAGAIDWFKFEALKFRLADSTFYTPDFIVLTTDGFLEAHEVKGFWQDDARVKIKVAASIYPIKFIAITRKKADWIREDFSR
jgi:hypothetical protein